MTFPACWLSGSKILSPPCEIASFSSRAQKACKQVIIGLLLAIVRNAMCSLKNPEENYISE